MARAMSAKPARDLLAITRPAVARWPVAPAGGPGRVLPECWPSDDGDQHRTIALPLHRLLQKAIQEAIPVQGG